MRKLGPPFLAVAGLLIAACLAYALWFAYETHEIRMPLRRRARMVALEQEPGFFWTTVGLYALLLPCCLFAAWSAVDDMIFARRLAQKNRSSLSRGD